jgi:hypothetical protein
MKTTIHLASCRFCRIFMTLGAAILVLGGLPGAKAQTDNFDDGDDNGWVRLGVLAPFGGVNTYSFPNGPYGKGYRIQCVSVPALGSSGTARAVAYRTNEYTDFYMSVDVVDWNNNLNQALVLIGRMTGLTNQLSPCPLPACPPGLGTVNGYICNYDANQSGVSPSNARGGQFQINRLVNEAPATIATANITLTAGKSYRMILKAVADLITAQLYDLEDLSAPLVTIQVNDSTYTSGVNGLISFSRDGTVTDVTFDNYYAATTDPNTDIAPAIRHPVPGTPQVVTRTPTNRFSNFISPSSAISFTAKTFATNEINTSATKLYLNGVDVSSALAPLPANSPTASFTAPGVLVENTLYAARIELANTIGALKSTNTFWFDTFSDAYLTNAPVKTIELEDYNYDGGKYQLDPITLSGYDTNGIPVNGAGVGYWDLVGTPEIDYHDNRTSAEGGWNDFRLTDFVGTLQGNRQDIRDLNHPEPSTPPWVDPSRPNDNTRHKYDLLGMKEYGVARTEAGEWLNYTRSFVTTNYYVFLRCGSYGAQPVRLDLVGGDPTTTNQTTTPLGTFQVQSHLMQINYRYEPLLASGVPVVVRLSGTNTLRVTMGGTASKDNRLLYLNYLLFVPTSTGPTVFDNFNDGNDTSPAPAWQHYDPMLQAGNPTGGTWTFPGGNSYRIQALPSPNPATFSQGRAGSVLPYNYTDFYESVDVTAWDDTIHQVFGVLARVTTPGLGTTAGYLFSYDRGNPASSTAGDMDIIRLVNEFPVGLTVTGADSIHLQTNKQYRFVFMGTGGNLTGQVYELPNTSTPIINMTASDTDYTSGSPGLLVANNNSPTYEGPGDATFDNFLATTAEPRLTANLAGGVVTVTWPLIPFTLQSATTLSPPSWTSVTNGITQISDQNYYSTPASGAAQYFRLIYP